MVHGITELRLERTLEVIYLIPLLGGRGTSAEKGSRHWFKGTPRREILSSSPYVGIAQHLREQPGGMKRLSEIASGRAGFEPGFSVSTPIPLASWKIPEGRLPIY